MHEKKSHPTTSPWLFVVRSRICIKLTSTSSSQMHRASAPAIASRICSTCSKMCMPLFYARLASCRKRRENISPLSMSATRSCQEHTAALVARRSGSVLHVLNNTLSIQSCLWSTREMGNVEQTPYVDVFVELEDNMSNRSRTIYIYLSAATTNCKRQTQHTVTNFDLVPLRVRVRRPPLPRSTHPSQERIPVLINASTFL